MCILVVEDDPLIRSILVEELEDAGYDVREAETGDAAYALLQSSDVALTVLVTDVNMPGQRDGIALAGYVRKSFPHVPVIYTTGRPDMMKPLPPPPATEVLVRKPYVPNDIIRCIQRFICQA